MNENGEDNMEEKREKPDPSMINSEYHIVYKRRDSHVDHTSDYRKSRLKYFKVEFFGVECFIFHFYWNKRWISIYCFF